MREIVVEYGGKLAVDWGWSINWLEPFDEHTLFVSNIPAEDWPGLIGCSVGDWHGYCGTIWMKNSQGRSVDTTGWERVIIRKLVKKPRRRQTDGRWVYAWENGRWLLKLSEEIT